MLLNRSIKTNTTKRPIKVIQFGGGNFLRAFADYLIQECNENYDFNGNVAIVQYVSPEMAQQINQQDGLYHLILQGLNDGVANQEIKLIDSVSYALNPHQDYISFLALAAEPQARYIISNTTEAGIVFDPVDDSLTKPATSFPAKLTQLLFARYQWVKGNPEQGYIILPCELIEQNGIELQKLCLRYAELWSTSPEFKQWLLEANCFCSTLVDRIVPGFPHNDPELLQKLGCEDKLAVVAEPYYSWVIEGAAAVADELIFNRPQFNVKLVEDLTPYRQLKVRLLNGVHSALVPVAYLSGIDTVRDATENDLLRQYLEQLIATEIIPTLSVNSVEAKEFATEVMVRFANPYIEHRLMSIALNSIAKFVTRDLPIILDYQRIYARVPVCLSLALAGLLVFYRGIRAEQKIELNDAPEVLAIFVSAWQNYTTLADLRPLLLDLLGNQTLWGLDLTLHPQFCDAVIRDCEKILTVGMKKAVEDVL